MFPSAALLALVGSVSAGSILWDGRLNGQTSSAFLNDWSFSNEVGPYQYYIHGDGPVKDYVSLGSSYKNPADSGSKQGIQITIDNSSVWNNDGMLRTELIPQTTAAINTGKRFYHFSMQHAAMHAPSAYEEHQVCFFESHFTEMKYGLIDGESGTLDTHLRWEVNSVSEWNVTFEAGVWHNIAYAIDFDAGSVGFYHSTGADDLKLVVSPISVSASSNGADWHLGVLRLPSTTGRSDTAAEDWHFSGVYIESGDITLSVSGPGSSSSGSASSASSAVSPSAVTSSTSSKAVTKSVKPSTSAVAATSSTKKSATSSAKPVSTVKAVDTSSAKPSTPSTPTSISTASPTTLTTKVKPTASSDAAPVSASSSSAPAVYGSITLTYSASSAAEIPTSFSVVEPTPTSVAVSTVPASSSLAGAPTSSLSHASLPHHHHHQHHAASYSSEVSPVSTSQPEDGDCVVKYVYV